MEALLIGVTAELAYESRHVQRINAIEKLVDSRVDVVVSS
jgi:hypothetical protein